MRRVEKRAQPPPELIEHTKTLTVEQRRDAVGRPDDREGYESLPKAPIRAALVDDQAALCCYCMRRIGPWEREMKIEHFDSQQTRPDLALAWQNMLGACRGGDTRPGQRPNAQPRTCDTAKAEQAITLDPRRNAGVQSLKYLSTGKLESPSTVHQHEIDTILNLNCALLVANRRSALDALLDVLRRRLGAHGSWTGSRLRTFLAEQKAKRPAPEYLGLLEYWLERHIARLG